MRMNGDTGGRANHVNPKFLNLQNSKFI